MSEISAAARQELVQAVGERYRDGFGGREGSNPR